MAYGAVLFDPKVIYINILLSLGTTNLRTMLIALSVDFIIMYGFIFEEILTNDEPVHSTDKRITFRGLNGSQHHHSNMTFLFIIAHI